MQYIECASMGNIIVGVDFDNTIVCYHDVFYRVAVENGLIYPDFPKEKEKIRDYLRKTNQENAWTEIQGIVYGPEMIFAKPFPDVQDFFLAMRNNGIKTCIISHKTQYPYRGARVDLHKAAYEWLDRMNLSFNQISFHESKKEKCQKIIDSQCDYFIDDLSEILLDPSFPVNTKKILFTENQGSFENGIKTFSSWCSIKQYLLESICG